MLRRTERLCMFEILWSAATLITDQAAKEDAEKYLQDGKKQDMFGGKVTMILHHNYGSAGNFGAGNPVRIKTLSVALTVLVSVIYLFTITIKGRRMLKTGLALIIGGAFSNTYDRLLNGYVIDYITFPKGPKFIRKFIWNIADFALIVGAMMVSFDQMKNP